MNIRGTFTVEGIVQGVGYREFVRNKAYELNIKGYVRNLKKNEAVEVVCEGEEAVVRQFPGLIDTRTDRIIVEKITQRYTKPTGRFERFSIRRDLTKEGTLEILEKLDTGFQMIKDLDYHITGKQGETLGKQDIMIGKQDIMIGKQDLMLGKQDETVKAIKEVGADVKAVSADVKAMDSNMSGRFDRLDAKYGQFGKTMKSVQKDTKGMASHMKRMNTGIKSVASDIKVIRKEATRGRKKPAPG